MTQSGQLHKRRACSCQVSYASFFANLICVQIVERPWQAGGEVKPKATKGREVLHGNSFEVITICFGRVQRAGAKLNNNLKLTKSQKNVELAQKRVLSKHPSRDKRKSKYPNNYRAIIITLIPTK
jgi:hypothetical protein